MPYNNWLTQAEKNEVLMSLIASAAVAIVELFDEEPALKRQRYDLDIDEILPVFMQIATMGLAFMLRPFR